MTAVTLLRMLRARAVDLTLEGTELRITAPKGALDEGLRTALRTHKAQLIELLEGERARADHDIAIVGMACRLPGAPNVEAYWQLLREGRSAVCEIPAERWDYRAWYSDKARAPRFMGFLPDAALFDAPFFQISPREARLIDPQQRLFLEVVWEAFESAGIDPTLHAGANVGVFVGCGGSAYGQRIWSALGPEDYAAGLGTQGFAIPNRTSYFFDFHGPSILVSTACSASLVSLHMACESLRRGESTLAIAGGVNLLLSPAYYLCMAHMGALSPDGTCRTFDRSANGIVLGEGVGALLLKPLSQAKRDGDRVLAVVRGSAVNHDGRTNGLSAPNPGAQAELVRSALADADLTAADISYVEAHGTGTALGDPMEVEALGQVFAGLARGSCRIGSVKTNLGHLETAAGVASVIKVVLALQHGELPPHVGYEQPNPLLSFGDTAFTVNTQLSAWPRQEGARRAGVSGFGMGGTNAHVILEEAPAAHDTVRPPVRPAVITVSARSEAALARQLERLAEHLSRAPDTELVDLARTLNAGRAHLPHRRAFTVASTAELIRELSAAGVAPGHVPEGTRALPRGPDEPLAQAYLRGARIDWQAEERARGGRVVTLPSYPWQHERHWVDADPNVVLAPAAPKADASESAHQVARLALSWEPLAALPVRAERAQALVLGGTGGEGQALATRLGAPWLPAWELDQAGLHAALTRHAASGQRLDVICLTALDAPQAPCLDEALKACLEPVLQLVQALVALRVRARLWLCTRTAQAVAGSLADPVQASLWGLARTVMLEHPELGCRLLDLDHGELELDLLDAVLARDDAEDQLALRGATLFGARLLPAALPGDLLALPRDGTVLVTGALGGLGLVTLEWLSARGVRSLTLFGRTPPEPAHTVRLAALEQAGTRVRFVRCDVSDREALRSALTELRAAEGPLVGVVHAAGALDDGVLTHQRWERFAHVLRAKAMGAAHLDELTRADPLAWFVSFSSLASLLGAPGQGNYAAANAYLDGLAHAQRARGLRGLSLHFGPWAEAGMAGRLGEPHLARMRAQGLHPLAPEAALSALHAALSGDDPEPAVLDVDWPRFAQALPPGFVPPLLARVLSAQPLAQRSAGDTILTLPEAQREAALVELVRSEAAKVLGSADPEAIDPERPLAELGVDSLMAVELRNALARALSRPLSATLLFDHPTLSALVRFLADELAGARSVVREARTERRADEPIAIVGVGLRLPDGVSDLAAFSRFLARGGDAIREVPRSRWDVDAYYDPDPGAPGKMYTRWGSFVEDVEGFDADFFGIAPREALQMDPQQRLLLEVTWEALEDAGVVPATLAGTRTGVFMGIGLSGYGQHQLSDERARIDGYTATGMITSAAVGRISYVLGLKGPSLAVETACSSSLVSVHLACQSLRSGESELAIAGGANLLLSPEGTIMFSKARAMSPTGRCKTFDRSADGYVRGEGVGVLLLRPLSRALADGDAIHAVIRGSAVNQDGRSGGLTAPNGPAQEAVLREALSAAGVQAHEVVYLEAHGTGTPLGDPIELSAAARVYGEGRDAREPLLVGSVKTQIGHLEMAAGVAGLLKVIVALKEPVIPRHLHLDEPNPHIPWSELPVRVTREPTAWPPGKRRLSAVSAFGFGGTNAHVVLEAGPSTSAAPCVPVPLLVGSAKTRGACQQLALRFAACLRDAATDVAALCEASRLSRTHFAERFALEIRDPHEAASALEAFARGAPSRVHAGHAPRTLPWGEHASLDEAARAYVAGATPSGKSAQRTPLPHYPWQRERYWLGPQATAAHWTVRWEPAPSDAPGALPERVLLVADQAGFAEQVATALRARSCEVLWVDPGAPLPAEAGALSCMLCFTALDAREDEAVEAQVALFGTLARMLAHDSQAPIWLITRHAQGTSSGDALAPAQAAAWGLGRALAAEQPARFQGLVDLESKSTADDLLGVLGLRGEQVAMREHRALVARLAPWRAEGARGLLLRDDAVYVLTGASGGVGQALARWLVKHGARHLLLVSRTGSDPAALDAHLETVRSDVSTREGVHAILERVEATGLPLGGVVHAAGAVDDALLGAHDPVRIERVLAAKVRGAYELDRQIRARGMAPELFLLVSSSAALLGAAGQGAYAAANAYLDGLAAARRARGEPALSVNFGPWDGPGMAQRVSEAQKRRWASAGLALMAPEAALRSLSELLVGSAPQALVADLDLSRLVRTQERAALALLGGPAPSERTTAAPTAGGRLRSMILARPRSERRHALGERLERDLSTVLGLPEGRGVDRERGFAELGVDSLLSLELKNRLSDDLALELPSTLALDHPTLERLTDYLLARVEESEPASRSATHVEIVRSSAAFDEPIAIIGMGLRLPGGVHDAESYWELLTKGVDATREVPEGRWDLEALYDPDPDAPGRIYTRRGGFLEQVDAFDAGFFGIAPREAAPMDPQQRLLLEVSWEALEHAGQAPAGLKGSRTGIFVGIGINDYGTLQGRGATLESIDAYRGTGNGYCFSAGRLSYHLGLQGPSLSVDTACSSSLVAIHLAAQSLRTGESDVALAGGVHLMLAPETMVLLCRTRALSPDGRCKTFSASADGYGRGEGAAMLVLKRLSDALSAGDRIEAVLRATAINHDGASSGLTVPNGPAQQAVIREALTRAGVEAERVSYVEAHGTGTALGDPMEVEALAEVYGTAGRGDRPLTIGSVKTNLGHLEAASGVAGLMKVVLALQHREIPPHLHFDRPSPHIAWSRLKVAVPVVRTAWASDLPRLAGVSSFGLSGTNAHALVEEAPALAEAAEEGVGVCLVPVSARTSEALRALCSRLARRLRASPDLTLAQVARTLGAGRTHFEFRWAAAVSTREQLIEALEGAAQREHPSVTRRARVALVYSPGHALHAQIAKVKHLASAGVVPEWVLGGVTGKLEQLGVAEATDLRTAPLSDARARAEREGATVFVELSEASRDELLRQLYVQGATLDFAAISPAARPVALPTYPWQRKRHWFEQPRGAREERTFHESEALVSEHRVHGTAIFPAAGYLELLQAHGKGALADLTIETPLRFAPHEKRVVRVRGDRDLCWLESRGEHETHYTRHASARRVESEPGLTTVRALDALRSHTVQSVEREALYAGMHDEGLDYGPLYRVVQRVHLAESAALAELQAPERDGSYHVHPALLDGCLQVFGTTSLTLGRKDTYLPLSVGSYQVHATVPHGTRLFVHARLHALQPDDGLRGDVELLSEHGALLISLGDVRFRRATLLALEARHEHRVYLGRVRDESAKRGVLPALHWRVMCARETALSEELRVALTRTSSDRGEGHGVVLVCDRDDDAFAHALVSVQELLREKVHTRLWMVVRGAEGAALLGLARTVELEHPELACTRVSLSEDASVDDVLCALSAEPRERELTVSRQGLAQARLVLSQVPASPPTFQVPSAGTVLVTGGTGALGLEVASWLVARGATSLMLLARSEPSLEAAARITALEASGARVTVARADVCDAQALSRALEGHRLVGMVHAAGVLDDGVLREQKVERCARVLAPKVRGGAVVAALARAHRPAFVLLFSSTAALFGAPGQGAYGAGNAQLDGLAALLRREGIAATSVQWGPWAEVGMASRQGASYLRRLAMLGMAPIGTADALRALDALLAGQDAVVSVLCVDRQAARSALRGGTGPALLDLLAPEGPAQQVSTPLRSRLSSMARDARRAELEALLHGQAARVLLFDPNEAIDQDTPLGQLGMDSLMAIELRNALGAALGMTFSATLLFDRPTLRSLTEFVESELEGGPSEAPEAAPPAPSPADEGIAIVGMGCRFPGGADSPALFWQLLAGQVDAITEVPAERWDLSRYFDEDPEAPGKMYARHGGFVRHLDRFDAHFFGISPMEARSMDPQQRLLLEVCWEALEHAGIVPGELGGSDTGVFVGIGASGYASEAMKLGDLSQIDAYAATGNTSSAAVGRLSYLLGLEGPNVSIDTACSSSLVSVHLACQSLRLGESKLAIAGGVNVLLSPEVSVMVSKARMLSPDGRCKAFDASADGYVRSEGCGLVVLKRLSDAERDGDRIWAVIRGTAVNQDGRSSGLTAPSGRAQEAVIRRALRAAGVAGKDVSYVEAHGTGTALGDPIEIAALANTYGVERAEPLCVGSVKTNIGHLEMAAGVAGLIKIALSFAHHTLPASLHLRTPNPHIPWADTPIEVLREARAFTGERRLAGLSSFGFSGTNAHAVLEAPRPVQRARDAAPGPALLLLSARTESALRALATAYADAWRKQPAWSVAEVARATHTTRARHERRLAIVASEPEEAILALTRFAHGQDEGLCHGRVLPPGARRVSSRELDTATPESVAADRALWRRYGVDIDQTGDLTVVLGVAETQREQHVLRQLAALVVHGVEPRWEAVDGRSDKPHLELPTYPWQRQRFWLDEARPRAEEPRHPWLRDGKVTLSAALSPLLTDHRVHGRVVVPAALLLDLMLAHTGQHALEDVRLHEALVLDEQEPSHLTIHQEGTALRGTSSEDEGSSSHDPLHVTARASDSGFDGRGATLAEAQARCNGALLPEQLYGALAVRGMVYGPALQTLLSIQLGAGEAVATLARSETAGHVLHPALLDGALQLLGAALATRGEQQVRLPVHFARIAVRPGATAPAFAHALVQGAGEGDVLGHVRLFDERGEPVAELVGVALHAVDDAQLLGLDAVRVKRHLYELTFQPSAPDRATGSLAGTRWAVLPDDTGTAARTCARLQAQGAEVVRVQAVEELHGLHCDGVLCLGALASEGMPPDGAEALRAGYTQALAAAQHVDASTRLVLITRGAVAAGAPVTALAPAQGATWGLGRTLLVEKRERKTLLLDLDPLHPERGPDEIVRALAANDEETQVAYREGVRLVPRLRPTSLGSARRAALRSDRSYLITGGLGALGLHAARELAARGARHLTLLSRSEPGESARGALRELEEQGVAVRCVRADVAERASLEAALAGLELPLAGVVHTAGTLDDALLEQQAPSRFERVLAAKVQGALHLRALTRPMALDFTLFFSSSAGTFGAAGQANYAAANASLDALAALERAEGKNTVSIAWGAWSGGGMATRALSPRRSNGAPFGTLAPGEGRAALGAVLDHLLAPEARGVSAQLVVAKLRVQRLARALGNERPPWLRDLLRGAQHTHHALHEELTLLDGPARVARVGELLRMELRRALGLPEAEPLPGDAELTTLGVDSLLAIEVPQVLGALFGLSFASTLLREQPTLDALASHIAGRLAGSEAAPGKGSVLVLKRATRRAALICLGGAPGDALYLGALSGHLPSDQPFYALEAPGLDGRMAPLSRMEDIAAHHLGELARAGLEPPFLLSGHSFGGFVAFEMARQLEARGHGTSPVYLFDSVGVDWNDAELPFDEGWVAGELARVLFYTLASKRPDLTYAMLEALPPVERVQRLVGHGEHHALASRLIGVMRGNLEAMVRYRVAPYQGPVHLFRATEPLDGVLTAQFSYASEPDLGWGRASGAPVQVHASPGNHFSMMAEPHVRALASALTRVLGLSREAAE